MTDGVRRASDAAGTAAAPAAQPAAAPAAAAHGSHAGDAVLTDVQLQDGNAFDLVGDLRAIGFGEDHLPTSVQIVGKPLGEDTLLQVASQMEAARPWAQHRPSLDDVQDVLETPVHIA